MASILGVVAACVGATPAISGGVTATSSSGPSVTIGPATATPAATRTLDSDQVLAAAALAAFAARIQDPDLTFRISMEEIVSIDGRLITSTVLEIGVAGNDFAGTIEAGGMTLAMTTVGESTYVQHPDGSSSSGERNDVVAQLVVHPWECVGSQTNLVFTSRAAPDLVNFAYHSATPVTYSTALMQAVGAIGQTVEVRLVVSPEGTPVSIMCFVAANVPTPEPGPGLMRVSRSTTFADVGSSIVIERPAP